MAMLLKLGRMTLAYLQIYPTSSAGTSRRSRWRRGETVFKQQN